MIDWRSLRPALPILIGASLIDCVDEAGYCRADLDETAARLGVPRGDVEAVLFVLHGFEPAGVCARDLAECLAIQLREKDRLDPCMQAFLAHLDLVAKRDFAQLSQICGVIIAPKGPASRAS